MSNSTEFKTYGADEVTLSVAGYEIESGFADGEFVSVEQTADDWTDKVSAEGREVARAKSNDRRLTVKIKLLQTSKGNDTLSQLRTLDLAGPNGAGVGAFLLRDRTGGLVVRGEKCWVMKPPTVGRGRELGECEWTLRVARGEQEINGNPAV